MKTLLICGATGFIGRNTLLFFSGLKQYKVRAVYHTRPSFYLPNVDWIKADLTNQADIEKVLEGVHIVVQAAATTSGSADIVNRPYIHVSDNAVMNSLLFRSAFHQHIEHVIFFSCSIMLPSSNIALTEDDADLNLEIEPKYYGAAWTKIYLEKMCNFYSRISDIKFTVIRHSNIYGPFDKFDLEKSHVFGASITKVLSAHNNSNVTIWGSGQEGRDLLYVDDLMDFVNKAICNQRAKFALYNCGYGEAISIKNLVEKIILHSKKNVGIEYDNLRPSIPTSLSLDCTKAKNELGWVRSTSIDEGIKLTIKWWLANIKNK